MTLKPSGLCLLEMVLQSHVKIEGVPSVPKANADESTTTCDEEMNIKYLKSTCLKVDLGSSNTQD